MRHRVEILFLMAAAIVVADVMPAPAEAQLFKRLFKARGNDAAQCDRDDCPHESAAKPAKIKAKAFWPFTDAAEEQQGVVPAGRDERNVFAASKLGGYVRANYQSASGELIDVYQARGKQRVVWAVNIADQWQGGLLRAIVQKAITGADQAGIILVGYGVDPTAAAACHGAGAWLVLIDPETGDAIRLIYPAKPLPPEVVEPSIDPATPADPQPVPDAVDPAAPADEPAAPVDEAAAEVVTPDDCVPIDELPPAVVDEVVEPSDPVSEPEAAPEGEPVPPTNEEQPIVEETAIVPVDVQPVEEALPLPAVVE